MVHIQAILPVFMLILAGYTFFRIGFPERTFWSQAARFTYFVFFPVLVFHKLAQAQFQWQSYQTLALALLPILLAMVVLLLIMKPFLPATGSEFTSLFQGGIRFNTYIALAAAMTIFGSEMFALATLAISMLIPLVNLFCVLILAFWGRKRPSERSIIKQILIAIAGNPLIIAALSGLAVNVSGVPIPAVVAEILRIMERPALTLGLLTVGAGLQWRSMMQAKMLVLFGTAVKMLIYPALTITGLWIFSIQGNYAQIAILFATLPTAPSAYILAQEMGGDTELMASLLTMQTLASMLIMPLGPWLFSFLLSF